MRGSTVLPCSLEEVKPNIVIILESDVKTCRTNHATMFERKCWHRNCVMAKYSKSVSLHYLEAKRHMLRHVLSLRLGLPV